MQLLRINAAMQALRKRGGGTLWSVDNSLTFASASSQYGTQSMSTPTNAAKWTFSTWLKIDTTGANKMILTAGVDVDDYDYIMINSTGSIQVYHGVAGSTSGYVYTGNVVTATDTWYHLTVKFDGSAASASRVTVYLDGVSQSLTVGTAWPSGGGYINTSNAHGLGVRYRPPSTYDNYHNGHLCETFFIDGQALDYTSFYDTGSPIEYTGTYGNNGFYLDYKDGTSTTTLGYDVSGNDNHWTLTNMTTGNQSIDTPEVTMASIDPTGITYGTLTNNNLTYTIAGYGTYESKYSTIGKSSGKWYCEMFVDSQAGGSNGIGITTDKANEGWVGSSATQWGYISTGQKANNGSSAYGAAYTAGDTIGMALDLDAGTLEFFKNGVSQGVAFTGLSGTFYAGLGPYSSDKATMNYGGQAWAYLPPAGYTGWYE